MKTNDYRISKYVTRRYNQERNCINETRKKMRMLRKIAKLQGVDVKSPLLLAQVRYADLENTMQEAYSVVRWIEYRYFGFGARHAPRQMHARK